MNKFSKRCDPDDYPCDKASYVDQSQYADNAAGITSRCLDIMSDARQLNSIIRTLEAVNMDRLANKLAAIQQRILLTAEPIPKLVIKGLDEGIAHDQHLLGGVLHLAMRGKLV